MSLDFRFFSYFCRTNKTGIDYMITIEMAMWVDYIYPYASLFFKTSN